MKSRHGNKVGLRFQTTIDTKPFRDLQFLNADQQKSPEKVPQSARLPSTKPPQKTLIRRYSESLINDNMTKYGTESELDAIFRETKENQTSAKRHDGVSGSDDANSPIEMMTPHHQHSNSVDSRDSNLEAYKEQIIRMSKKQFSNKNEGKLMSTLK